ncbi:hypothetical protein FBU30_009649 [Linnemannia zychae]|nr:hypothetical protein FBU30_009649 [Linnemannia zychae]
MSYSYDPREFKELYFHLDRFTQGDIIVSQHSAASKDTTPPTNVTIKVTAKGDTVYSIQPFKMIASPNSIQSRIEANVFRWDLFWWPGGPPEEQLCNRVHVEIIFPPGLESYKLLRIQNRSLRGDVTVSMDPNTEFSSLSIDSTALEIERQKMKMTEMMAEGKKKTKPVFTTLGKCPVGAPPTRANLMTIEQVDVKAKNGNVTVTGVRVTEELKATSELGEYVYVDADAKKRVYAYSSSLAVVELTQNHRNLDVTVEAEYWAQVEMKSTFIGHLEMMTTTNVFPPILIQYDYEFVPQIVEWQLVTGYIPDAKHNGTEPPNELPRIQIRGEGTIVKLNGCGQN